ncbi:CD44 antigen [Neoarius graeffei]|uniref:CD44 antigen n=1 Tax=Neoarius graeffei TaxID=443677 RepID=UPI00298CAC9C|nr:CD44 antigen [Neoarius graeffei]
MWILLLGLTSGLIASSWASPGQKVKVRDCSYKGVFHIQGNDRYTLDFDTAQKLCEELGTTLASNEQMTVAHGVGLETCRYGWVSSGNITIPRHVANSLCAQNMTGVITLVPLDSYYDAYCYDQTDISEKNCIFEIKNLESDPEQLQTTEDTESPDLNHTEIPSNLSTTEVLLELHANSTITAVTELIHTTEKMNPTSSSSQNEHNVLVDMLDQTTQLPTKTTEPAGDDDDVLNTESPISSLDSNGSGIGETTHITTSEPLTNQSGDSKDTIKDQVPEDTFETTIAPTTKDESPDQSSDPKGRIGSGFIASPPEKEASSDSIKDWLVILIVVVAIASIILVGALVATRNRLCGRSQTLIITSKSSSEGNGTAASAASPQAQEREQEMVTLMNKEKVQENGNTEEFTVITLEESPEKNQQA